MTAFIDLATVGLIFFGWFALAFVGAVLIGRFIAGGHQEAEAERHEVDGSWSAYLASMEARKRRVDEVRRNWSEAS